MLLNDRLLQTQHHFVAGRLKAALSEIAGTFEAASDQKVKARFDPSGLLKDAILAGAWADLFASAKIAYLHSLC